MVLPADIDKKKEIIIKNISRYITLNHEEREYFESILHYRKLAKGKILLHHGEIAQSQYFVISGCLRNYSMDEDGKEHIITFAIADWWISDLYSYITETPAEQILDALIPTEVFEICKKDMEEVYVRIPKFERFFRILFQNAIVIQMRRIRQVMSIPAEERYKVFIKQYPGIFREIPLKYIASYLGISPEFLSKIRNKIAHT
jgi:CRP-like cAMP-binding protein